MHVFCPDCNAEYKVNERSSLTKTVKFVCIECGNSWIDKFEKFEQTNKAVSASQVPISKDGIGTQNKESGIIELNSLALEEVQNSFGNHKNTIETKNNNTEREHTFQFETHDAGIENDNGPSKTFPKIRSNNEAVSDNQIEERDAKDIAIEKRLKESSELLQKAKQPDIESKEAIQKKNKPESRRVLVTLSSLLIVGFFSYNLAVLFLEEILREVPFAPEILSQISSQTALLKDILFTIIKKIMDFIPTLA